MVVDERGIRRSDHCADFVQGLVRSAEATRDRYAKKASVLRGLLATRHDQIAAGTWPAASDDPTPA